jgi:hypothetical protein
MRKAIIILDGVSSDGKTLFSLICKNENHKFYSEDGFWTWQINSSNVLGVASRTLGATERDDTYFEFIKKLRELANQYYDFENSYLREMCEKFNGDDRVDLLIIYNVNSTQVEFLKEDFGAYHIMLSSTKSNKNFENLYDRVLIWDKESFVEDTLSLLQILTKDEVQLENKE